MKLHPKSNAAVAALIACGLSGAPGAIVLADDVAAPETQLPGPTDPAAVQDRFDALIDEVTSRLAAEQQGDAAPSAEVAALKGELTTAQTQIEVLKAVVVEALLAQSQAESALASTRGETEAQLAALREERAAAEARNQILADELEAVTENLVQLRAEVDQLREGQQTTSAGPDDGNGEPAAAPGPPAGSSRALEETEPEPATAPFDATGGPLEPIEDGASTVVEPPAVIAGRDEATVDETTADDVVDPDTGLALGEIHFDPGSARLTPGGVRKTREAAERIQSMEVAAVRVIGYADTTGGAGINEHLSRKRAGSIAAMLEDVGVPADKIEIVGRGEEGIPEPTADGVSEPLNRCAGIFVVPAFPK